MAISRKSYSTPSSTAGILGVGSGSSGGFKISPNLVLVVAIIFVIIIYILSAVSNPVI